MLFVKMLAVGAAGLAILFVYPTVVTVTDSIIAAWDVVPPATLEATANMLPILLLGAIFVGLTWWLFAGTGE